MKLINKNIPLVVIFGRTNVGKSTLFNCLVEKNQAIVSPKEGTTRDSNIGLVGWQGIELDVIDTGGIMDLRLLKAKKIKSEDIDEKVQLQARTYLKRADLILFLVDSRTGLLPQDSEMSLFLKKNNELLKKVLLVANKADSIKLRNSIFEFNKLNLGEPIPISAATGSGTGDLLDLIVEKLKNNKNINLSSGSQETETLEEGKACVKACILGQPNAGKSSLLNKLLGYERAIVSPIAHTTREPQDTEVEYQGNKIILVDTAGMSKKGTKTKGLEKFGIEKSLAALQKADVALLVLDINKEITHQDLKIVEEITNRKKSLIIIANKWDLVEERDVEKFKQYIYSKMPFCRWAEIHFASALTGSKVDKIYDLIIELYGQRKIKLSDTVLKAFMGKLIKRHKPSRGKGVKNPRIFSFKQIDIDPPYFEVKIGSKEVLHFSYLNFIENRLREKFGFKGTPIAMYVRKNKAVHGKTEQ